MSVHMILLDIECCALQRDDEVSDACQHVCIINIHHVSKLVAPYRWVSAKSL